MSAEMHVPTQSLKETIRDLETIASATTGKKCRRCGGTDFNKAGFSKLLGKRVKRICCRSCGYMFGISELQEEFSRNRAARILNLDNKKLDNYLDSIVQYGICKKSTDGKYEKLPITNKHEYYHNVPLFHHLIASLGRNPKRADFEKSLKVFPDENLSKASKIKRDVLWRRYQEITIEVFICEKCNFCRTCKKDHTERPICPVVKKSRTNEIWVVDIQL